MYSKILKKKEVSKNNNFRKRSFEKLTYGDIRDIRDIRDRQTINKKVFPQSLLAKNERSMVTHSIKQYIH